MQRSAYLWWVDKQRGWGFCSDATAGLEQARAQAAARESQVAAEVSERASLPL